ncbi:MAG: choice-of-anchor D domain-containing protein [Planctomycetes bacterium]|nr:choice-of-anchor D domain-containing protein [Planctomycetota bacterium]
MLRAHLLFCLLCTLATVAAAQSYTVSSSNTTYTDIASPNVVSIQTLGVSAPISPAGFSTDYFGGTYTTFRIAGNGYVLIGAGGNPASKLPNVTAAPGLVISPAWVYLDQTKSLYGALSQIVPAPGTIGWSFNAGVLEVEWKNIPLYGSNTTGVRMKMLLDTTTGAITFQYGKPHNGASGATSTYANTVCIAGPTGTTAQEVFNGEISGYVAANGSITTWPQDQSITFTPVSTSVPSISVSDGTPLSSGQAAPGTNRDFGSLDVTAGQSAALTITISNGGSADLDVTNFSVVGDTNDFVFDTNNLASVVTPGSSTYFTVAFDPLTAGQKVAQVSFNHNDGSVSNPFTVNLLGLGTQTATAPLIVVKRTDAGGAPVVHNSTLDFGTIDAGTATSITVFIQNAGTANLNVDAPSFTGGDFSISAGALPATLTPGMSTTFQVTYSPAVAGTSFGDVQFTHNDSTATSPYTINLTGTATSGGGTTPPAAVTVGGGGGGGCVAAAGENLVWVLLMGLGVCVMLSLVTRRRSAS